MNSDKKFFIKLHKDYLNSKVVKVIESLPNGEKYMYLYIKLLLMSTDQGGYLQIKENIPLTSGMIATLTNTNVDTVMSAFKVFEEFNLISLINNIAFMNELPEMVQSIKRDSEKRQQRRQAQKVKNALLLESPYDVRERPDPEGITSGHCPDTKYSNNSDVLRTLSGQNPADSAKIAPDDVRKKSGHRPTYKEKETETEIYLNKEKDKDTHKKKSVCVSEPLDRNNQADNVWIESYLLGYARKQKGLDSPPIALAKSLTKDCLAKGYSRADVMRIFPLEAAKVKKIEVPSVNPDWYYDWMEEI